MLTNYPLTLEKFEEIIVKTEKCCQIELLGGLKQKVYRIGDHTYIGEIYWEYFKKVMREEYKKLNNHK